jgi:hypothetical protein
MVRRRIDTILLVLIEKRQTVAEKAIQEELKRCAVLECELLLIIQKAVKTNFLSISDECRLARRINIKLNKQLQALIKAAKYDLNYLEQYFEHSFWLDLSNENYSKRLSELIAVLKTKLQ